LPADKNNDFLSELLDSAKFLDRIIFHLYLEDTTITNPDLLVSVANDLTDTIQKHFVPALISRIEGRIDPFIQYKLFDAFYKYLPLYLEEKDYIRLDSLIAYGDFEKMLGESVKVLNSPAGMMYSRFFFRDPLSLVPPQLRRLRNLQIDDSLMFYQNYLFTSNQKHLIFFITPADAGNTGKNADFIKQLNNIISSNTSNNNHTVCIEYLGTLPIAVANAQQIKKDIALSVSIAIVIIILLIYYFFRRKRNLWLILLPSFFGITVALLFFAVFKQKVSVISLSIGSVLLGITVNYALHLLTDLRHNPNVKEVIKNIAAPILVGSLTTALAFSFLMLLSSPALKQLGLFAAISTIFAAISTILFLPVFVSLSKRNSIVEESTLIDKIAHFEKGNRKIILFLILIITLVMLFFSRYTSFEKDIEKSNFMPEFLRRVQQNLNNSSGINQKKIYLLSFGRTINEALKNTEINNAKLSLLIKEQEINAFYGISSLVFSIEKQQDKINLWNTFWTKERTVNLRNKLNRAALKNHIKPYAFKNFFNFLETEFKPISPDTILESFNNITANFCIKLHDRVIIASVIPIDNQEQKQFLAGAFNNEKNTYLLDRKDFFSRIFDNLQKDFNKLFNLSLLMVFAIILLYFGRIEMTMIAFLPMLISWIWIVGIMGITGTEFNYFNIMICTLIFGLGDDYSIFITEGLLQKYKFGKSEIQTYKSSILISALTTLAGLGVLILAKHPALRSIASLSVIGIVSSVIISFTLQPVLFNLLTESKGKKLHRPIELYNLFLSIIIFGSFGILSIILTLLLPLFYILPAKKPDKRFWMRAIIGVACKIIMGIYHRAKIDKLGFDKNSFKQPSVIISNHQSMVDILLFLSLSPRILILTKDWVWNSPFFGLVVRFCGHINVSPGYDTVLNTIKQRTDEGCSIVVFPEGSRTDNGGLKRFHKGGFFIAQQQNLPIQAFLLHGLWDVLPHGTFVLSPGRITVKRLFSFFVENKDPRAYYNVSKDTCLRMRKAYEELKKELETPYYLRHRIFANYTYKGPVLENYMKIKLKIEKYYEVFDHLIPENATITDIGCGYGAMAYMLSLRSKGRKITAIDYDEKKINVAHHCELANHCAIKFETADALEYHLPDSDVFLISDMLHYLPSEKQIILINKCVEKLNTFGLIIIRDGDSQKQRRHYATILSEYLSTNIGFNKTKTELSFFSKDFIETIAADNNMQVTIINNSNITSNLIYVLKRNSDEQYI
jgi:1-acyl-sn-glycerol-3-phosphate acyltransferase